MPFRLGERRRHAVRPPALDHLGGAFRPGRAMHDAVGAGPAFAVGAAVIAVGVLRELAGCLDAGRLERVGRHCREGEVARVGDAGEGEGAGKSGGQDE